MTPSIKETFMMNTETYRQMQSNERSDNNEKLRKLIETNMELVPLEDTISVNLDSKAGYEST